MRNLLMIDLPVYPATSRAPKSAKELERLKIMSFSEGTGHRIQQR